MQVCRYLGESIWGHGECVCVCVLCGWGQLVHVCVAGHPTFEALELQLNIASGVLDFRCHANLTSGPRNAAPPVLRVRVAPGNRGIRI